MVSEQMTVFLGHVLRMGLSSTVRWQSLSASCGIAGSVFKIVPLKCNHWRKGIENAVLSSKCFKVLCLYACKP